MGWMIGKAGLNRNRAQDSKRRRLQIELCEARRLLFATPLELDSMIANSSDFASGGLIRTVVEDEAIVAFRSQSEAWNWRDFAASESFDSIESLLGDFEAESLLETRDDTGRLELVHFRIATESEAELLAKIEQLSKTHGVAWAAPNYRYAGEVLDLTPNDPQFPQQYHHNRMNVPLAWDTTLGSSNIVIGVTDQGVDMVHEDLAANIWQNVDEIANNGIDDDANGYIDDIRGWDFVTNDNDPTPVSSTNDHGTHVAGIVAAVVDNAIGIAGVAGRSKIMPLRIQGTDGGFTSTIMASTFRYAADNGAKIVNTSYNIDGFANDATFRSGLQYYYDLGGLHFNSAGNNGQLNPVRQVFHQTLLVANTTSTDAVSTTSNYGTGVDLAAPGTSIQSTLLNNAYGLKSGTSMAAPNAAGVAALIWAAYPTWTRDQVAAALFGTADNIDAVNSTRVGLVGGGRVNAGRAINNALPAPRVQSLTGLPAEGALVDSLIAIRQFSLRFNQIMNPADINNVANIRLIEAGPNGTFNNSDDVNVPLTRAVTYMIGTNDLGFTVTQGNLQPGRYRFIIDGSVSNPFFTDIDGNGDSVGGDAFVRNFVIGEPVFEALAPLGSGLYKRTNLGTISTTTEVDTYALNLNANQRLTVQLRPTSTTLRGRLDLVDGLGNVLATASAASNGQIVSLDLPSTNVGGVFRIEVRSTASTLGNYEVHSYLNGLFEAELNASSPRNDTLSTAQAIDGQFRSVNPATPNQSTAAILGNNLGTSGIVSADFENGVLHSNMTRASFDTFGVPDANGRIRVKIPDGTGNTSNFALMMDRAVSGAFTLNEAVWTVDLTGYDQANLTFSHASISDELTSLPATFTNRANGDGVAISPDGVNWRTIFTPTAGLTAWANVSPIDLIQALNAMGSNARSNIRIKFQQYDDFPITSDGRGYDNLLISSPLADQDWYQVTLGAGERLSAALDWNASATGAADVAVMNAAGTVFASGQSGATNAKLTLDSFIAPTAGAYFIRVSTTLNAEYRLLVGRNLAFDRESNSNSSLAISLDGVSGAVGYANDSDWYFLTVASSGDRIFLKTLTPNDTTIGDPTNSLNPQLELYSPTGLLLQSGTTLADGRNESIELLNAPTPGVYRVRVVPFGTTVGEYVLDAKTLGTVVVTDIVAAGSAWNASFIDAVDGSGFASGNGLGYSLTSGFIIPNTGVDRIYVQFSEPVLGFNAANVSLLGVDVADYSAAPSLMTVSYDSANRRGVIQLSSTISNDKLRLVVSDAVTDGALTRLDGDANGLAGGNLNFRFNTLVGDASNDGSVNGGELPIFAASFNRSAGSPSYNPRADWNADGAVNGGDIPVFSVNFNRSLPIGEPGPGPTNALEQSAIAELQKRAFAYVRDLALVLDSAPSALESNDYAEEIQDTLVTSVPVIDRTAFRSPSEDESDPFDIEAVESDPTWDHDDLFDYVFSEQLDSAIAK